MRVKGKTTTPIYTKKDISLMDVKIGYARVYNKKNGTYHGEIYNRNAYNKKSPLWYVRYPLENWADAELLKTRDIEKIARKCECFMDEHRPEDTRLIFPTRTDAALFAIYTW